MFFLPTAPAGPNVRKQGGKLLDIHPAYRCEDANAGFYSAWHFLADEPIVTNS